LQTAYRYLIFSVLSLSLFSLYYLYVELPSKTLSILSIFILVTYPWWRRTSPYPGLTTYLLYAVTMFWLYEAWYRLQNTLLISNRYYSDIPPRHVDFETALLGAAPFIVVALVLLVDELFISRPPKKYFYDVDLLEAPMRSSQKKAITRLLKRGDTLTLYSKSGITAAKAQARALALDHPNISFTSEERSDTQPKNARNLATLF